MIADLILPIDSLRGMLRKDGYYFRMYRGKQIVQRCPNRKEHVKTDGEKANQERFIERYGRSKKPQNDPKNIGAKWASDVNGRNHHADPALIITPKCTMNAGYHPAQRT